MIKLKKKAFLLSFFLFSFCCYQRSQLYYTNNYTRRHELNNMGKRTTDKLRFKTTSERSCFFFTFFCFEVLFCVVTYFCYLIELFLIYLETNVLVVGKKTQWTRKETTKKTNLPVLDRTKKVRTTFFLTLGLFCI